MHEKLHSKVANSLQPVSQNSCQLQHPIRRVIYSYFEKGCRKNVHATIPKGSMGYEQYAVPDTVAVEPTFVAFL